ncbi:MAG: hydrogenase formation protein HypD [Planctomyces sp.]|nr:hydrogenase formation protein HypD [Planctomyces sp.]
MKHVDEFRDPSRARSLLDQIRRQTTRRWVIMEVCGGQTHGLLRHGIDLALEDTIELIHGPGCPVCVTDEAKIDRAVRLSMTPGILLASFGDMLRVPGTSLSLAAARAEGASVREFYSPTDAVTYAAENPDQHVVFFAVGFETTAPATSLAVLQAKKRGLRNFSLLVSHVRVQPAMELIMASEANRVEGFLAAGHVCCVTGFAPYEDFAGRWGVPVVVTGFEPVDLLLGIAECVDRLEHQKSGVANCFGRSVALEGNRNAQSVVDDVYEVCESRWRGLGVLCEGGFRLREEYREFDAEFRFPEQSGKASEASGKAVTPVIFSTCRAGEVLSGRIQPCACGEFGSGCTPEHPLGAPMVSSEGACAAWFRYRLRSIGS